MIRISLNLPFKKRVHLHVVERRGASNSDAIFPKLEEVKRAKKGSKISRYFKHIFEHKNIKRFFGANLTLMLTAAVFVPGNPNYSDLKIQDENIIIEESVVLKTENSTRFPVDNVVISQGYSFFHPGLDFDGLTGDTIYPVMSGFVKAISFSKYAYGNAVLVNHGGELTTLYAHLSFISVEKGQKVTSNTKIGEMGATGRATGDHLHFEVRENGIAINPYSILPR